ncbi:sensor histidine kinase [Desulfoluna spongiiphila]|uniref:histidine kinase n=1 Tax=Desulfoluna spongiiphila TaxID=419481 RepID=A0A1G5J3K9_9BACT|nr:ATP-binding protein [Desulfoluna spongiiphila]SCY82774.1 Signal transduction histidine kinase [Desulfoluna spongiiphila]VVS94448.1 histidine kinase domain [Desulfoluna spongiiphila]
MSLKRLRNITRTLGFRVGAWYSAIFIGSSALLFILAYLFLGATLRAQDYEEIQLELREVQTLYDIGGVTALNRYVDQLGGERRSRPLFIRVADRANRTRHIFSRESWEDFNLDLLSGGCGDCQGWQTLSCRKGTYVLDVLSGPLTPRGNRVQVGMSSQRRQEILSQFRRIFLVVMVPLFALGLGGGLFLSRRTLRPIRGIIKTVRSIDAGTMEARVKRTHTGDELDELAGLFNTMLDSIHGLIIRMENSLDDVAHDLRTPMTRLRNVSEMALREGDDPDLLRQALEKGIEESDRILSLLTTLMDVSEAETGMLRITPYETDLTELIETIVEMYRFVAEEKEVRIDATIEQGLVASVDPHRLSQALANILDNAVKFTPEGKTVHITASREHTSVCIGIRDAGPGIPPEDIPRIWDRLFRGDRSRSEKGLGLGLSLVRGIVAAHHGEIHVESREGEGALFTVVLPG